MANDPIITPGGAPVAPPAGSVTPPTIDQTATSDFVFPRDVTATRALILLSSFNWKVLSSGGYFSIFDVSAGNSPLQIAATGLGGGGSMFITRQVDMGGHNIVDIGGLACAASLVASAILQADSTSQGFLPPRMTTTQKAAIASPAEGLTVYDTTLHKLCVFTGSVWETVTSA